METSKKVLLIDDTPKNLRLLSDLLINQGFEVSSAINGSLALQFLEKQLPDLILLDIRMPEMDGFEVCRRIKENPRTRQIPIIFISALDNVEDKITAFTAGGVDYVTKPFQVEEVIARVSAHVSLQHMQRRLENAYKQVEAKVVERTKALKEANEQLNLLKNRLKEENNYLQEEIKTTHNFSEIIGESKTLKQTLALLEQVGPTDSTVLILGETGTGKELLARAVHHLSTRKEKPLVKVNCAALPSNLIESELFGHERGAFTGATTKKPGRFQLADKGTIFLDEIGDLPLELQAKLLRVLQEGEFERLGGTKTLKVDVRVIAATNRDLDELRSKGSFRDDLFYRLNTFPVKSPALRDRKEDIPQLAQHFLNKYAQKSGKEIKTISAKSLKKLESYHWPGNIRELENEIERSVIINSSKQLEITSKLSANQSAAANNAFPTLDEVQRDHILAALDLTNGKVSGARGAASLLGLKPTTLDARMKKLGITISKKANFP